MPLARIGEALNGQRARGFRGANVTVPHKQAVVAYLEDMTPAAKAIGAVNTILVHADGSFLGDNTEARGFVADLRDNGVDPAGSRVLVLGAGGSARAIVYGLADAGAAEIRIANRTQSRADDLAHAMGVRFPTCKWETGQGVASSSIQDIELIVNCTSVGMEPDVDSMPWNREVAFCADQTVYDLVYNPLQTRLLKHALECGAHAINGMGMLVWQGAIAFELWTGEPAPLEAMKHAVGVRQN